MTQIQKLYGRIKNNPRNVSYDDLSKLMEYFGFEVRNRASHYTFRHERLKEIITVKKEPGQIKAVYVKRCLAAIDVISKE